MKGEDDFLEEQYGRKRPFKVPDGYLENITMRVMSQLPERQSKRGGIVSVLRANYRYVAGIAACVCLLVFGTALYMGRNAVVQGSASSKLVHNEASYSDNFIDYVADYTMIDNNDMYSMIADYE